MSVLIRSFASKVTLATLGFIAASAFAQPTRADAVAIYDSTQIAFDRYTVVRRLGITGWESAVRIRGHGDIESAQRAVLGEAARFGADGVINLICFDQTDRVFRPAGFYCYGNAIKLKK